VRMIFAILLLLSTAPATADPLLAFITSTSGTGDLHSWQPDAGIHAGLAAADAICQVRAAAADLPQPEQFVAWMSDDVNDAYCRVLGLTGKAPLCGQAQAPAAHAGPWWRTDGQAFAGDLNDFSYGRIFRALNVDEFGTTHGAVHPFTATDSQGTKAQTYATCLNWTDASAVGNALGGTLSGTTRLWTDNGGNTCKTVAPIYCLQKGQGTAIVDPSPHLGRLGFITDEAFNGNLGSSPGAAGKTGVAAADALCRFAAGAQHMYRSFTYRAWISDGSTSAASRFVNEGPWYRIDGVPIANTLAELSTHALQAPLNTAEIRNEYFAGERVWTGVLGDGSPASAHCNQWTSASGSLGETGIANHTDVSWLASQAVSCSTSGHLYCLADNDTIFAGPFDPVYGF